jgi:L-lactate dehydrogenase complex protein LldG
LWLTDQDLGQRIAPFITQHLAIILQTDAIVPTMHQAYQLISEAEYGFGTFIAGPSKTADIEQSLVLGAHGARSLTVFLLRSF